MHVCESVKRKARGTVGVWAAERDEQKKQRRRDEEQRTAREDLIGRVGGCGILVVVGGGCWVLKKDLPSKLR